MRMGLIKFFLQEAEFRSPDKVARLMSQNLYLRAMGFPRVDRSRKVGKSTRQLERWEIKIEQNLDPCEEAELVRTCVNREVDARHEVNQQ